MRPTTAMRTDRAQNSPGIMGLRTRTLNSSRRCSLAKTESLGEASNPELLVVVATEVHDEGISEAVVVVVAPRFQFRVVNDRHTRHQSRRLEGPQHLVLVPVGEHAVICRHVGACSMKMLSCRRRSR